MEVLRPFYDFYQFNEIEIKSSTHQNVQVRISTEKYLT